MDSPADRTFELDHAVNKPDYSPALGHLSRDFTETAYAVTGTGLDQLVETALIDPGLNQRTDKAEIIDGVKAAADMNVIVIEAIRATGVANDGAITADDVYVLSDWIVANRRDAWITAHGNDENGIETGFHKIQDDGGALYVFGDKAIDQVADGIYHLGFGYHKDRLINEDGNGNARVEEVAHWLSELLVDDLAAGTLANTAVTAEHAGTTGTGLDALVAMINDDPGLERKRPGDEIKEGAEAADVMNTIIIEGIKELGLADDGTLDPSEVFDLADWIKAERQAEWLAAHGNDEDNVETAFHLVQNDGAETRAFGRAGVDTVADAIYHLGFGYKGDRLINEDGNKNERVTDVTYWLNSLLADDLANGSLATGNGGTVAGSTGTGLDVLVNLIGAEQELNRRLPQAEIEKGAAAADAMNKIIIDGIKATGIANDGQITKADVKDLSDWIKANAEAPWIVAHGDDEDDEETGFHLVQNDGAKVRLYDQNAINTVADGLYHLGFGYEKGRLINEDGNGNASLTEVAFWLEGLLADDLASGDLRNPDVDLYPQGTTGTALDEITQLVSSDAGLVKRFSASELREIALDVDALNKILVRAITETGVANDGSLTEVDVALVGKWIAQNEAPAWRALRGDYDDDTGIVGLAWDGGVAALGTSSVFNSFTPALYSLGFDSKWGGIRDEDGDWRGTLEDTAAGMNVLLAADLQSGAFYNAAQAPIDPATFANDAVAEMGATDVIDDDNYAVVDHNSILSLDAGTIAFSFAAEQPSDGYQVLFAKDGAGSNDGDMRIYLSDGVLHVKISQNGSDHYLKLEDEPVDAGRPYDLALTFDDGSITLWLDGVPRDHVDGTGYDMTANTSDIIIGASNGHQEAGGDVKIIGHFQGAITGFAVYDRALEQGEITGLSGGANKTGTNGNNDIAGTDGHDLLSGGLGRDVLLAGDGNDIVFGGYGADLIVAGAGHDVLDGGHGQDSLNAGAGDDILLSTSDGREPMIGQLIYGSNGRVRDDDGSVDFDTLTIYSDQPIPGDDVLTGGAGADIFRFQWMINAKEHIILEHVREDGSINWKGVAGENEYLHDHWVDTIGHDTITDFSRAEGDRIEVAGHTLTLKSITYTDIDGDGTDESVIAYKSNQGNGGAHDQDDLGTITVFGDKVTAADITQLPSNGVFYGIVENVSELSEAVTPLSIDTGTARALTAGLTTTEADNPRGDAIIGPKVASQPNLDPATRSGTGLDQILEWIETDPGLAQRTDADEIEAGSAAAAAMNAIIIEAIKATGAANDGVIDAGDVYSLATWIAENREAAWLLHHGDDEQGVETGFHLVQNDGAVVDAYGRNSINTVADAIYHLGFGYKGDRLINEDGNKNERVESVAFWLNDLLADDLAAGSLVNPAAGGDVQGTTGTGLDDLVALIQNDPELSRRIPDVEQQKGAAAADAMNVIIVQSIKKLGLANDGVFTAADVKALADDIKANHYDAWLSAHGNDEDGVETGFHLVQNDGAIAQLYGRNGVDTIADGIYHLGFGYNKNGNLINEDGNSNASTESVAHWLNELLADDMDALANPNAMPRFIGTTDTGLDALVDMIGEDPGLARRVSLDEIKEGAEAADMMNQIIVQSIKATGIANDGRITSSDVATLADFIKENHSEVWLYAHGNDENNVETGFHLIQGDGGELRLYSEAGVNTVADGLYHLGFGHEGGRLLNEDGNKNASLSDVAYWLEDLLEDDLASGRLENTNSGPFSEGTTGTGLDLIVEMVATDEGLMARSTADDISTAARSADGLNKILIEAMQATGVANDGALDEHDLKLMDAWIAENRLDALNHFNGTDEKGEQRTGFELAEIWEAASPLFGENGIRTVVDAIYSLGYGIAYNKAVTSRDGGWKEELTHVADWMNILLEPDLADGKLFAADQAYATPDTFADRIVYEAPRDVITNGQGGFVNVAHTDEQALTDVTIALSFNANDIPQDKSATLFTKDGKHNGDGGHTALYFHDGDLYVRLQDTEKSHYIKVAERAQFQTGTTYNLAMIMGEGGLRVFIDGKQVASHLERTITWENNAEDIVVGGNGGSRQPGQVDGIHSAFDGVISGFTIYDGALNFGQIAGLNGENTDVVPDPNADALVVGPPIIIIEEEVAPEDNILETPMTEEVATPPQPVAETPTAEPDPVEPETEVEDQVTVDPIAEIIDDADDSGVMGIEGGTRTGSDGTDVYVALAGENILDGGAGHDLLMGGFQSDTLKGGDGHDALIGDLTGAMFAGNDTLEGGAGNDMLQAGDGLDTFVFGTNDGDDVIAQFALSFTDVAGTDGFNTAPTGRDFTVGVDKIALNGFTTVNAENILNSSVISDTADGALFSAEGTSILMFGVAAEDLSASDFLFS